MDGHVYVIKLMKIIYNKKKRKKKKSMKANSDTLQKQTIQKQNTKIIKR